MKRFLVIALSTLMLSGCMAEWKSNRTGARWKDQPAPSAFPSYNPGPNSGGGPQSGVY